MNGVLIVLVVIAVVGLLLITSSVRMVQQYERGVVLRFGRLLPQVRQPGLRVMVPIADRMRKVPVQTIVLDVPSQGTITQDNVTIGVDAVVYFRVDDPVRAVINVENYLQATSQVAQTSLRSVIGRADLDTLLSDRDRINGELRDVIDAPTEDWGISVDRVEIKDISLPEGMRRSMSRQAEAERDRRARVINADGELQASTKLSQAAAAMGETPGRLAAAAPPDRHRRGVGQEQHIGDAVPGGAAALLRARRRRVEDGRRRARAPSVRRTLHGRERGG